MASSSSIEVTLPERCPPNHRLGSTIQLINDLHPFTVTRVSNGVSEYIGQVIVTEGDATDALVPIIVRCPSWPAGMLFF